MILKQPKPESWGFISTTSLSNSQSKLKSFQVDRESSFSNPSVFVISLFEVPLTSHELESADIKHLEAVAGFSFFF